MLGEKQRYPRSAGSSYERIKPARFFILPPHQPERQCYFISPGFVLNPCLLIPGPNTTSKVLPKLSLTSRWPNPDLNIPKIMSPCPCPCRIKTSKYIACRLSLPMLSMDLKPNTHIASSKTNFKKEELPLSLPRHSSCHLLSPVGF